MLSAIVRIKHDLNDINSDDHDENNFYAELQDDEPLVVKAYIVGPEGTPIANHLFEFNMQFPENYPIAPPTITFMAEANHPDALEIQRFMTTFLENSWTSVYTIKDILNLILNTILYGSDQMAIAYEVGHLYIQ